MLLLPFFEIPYGEKVAKNVKKQYVQVLPRSTHSAMYFLASLEMEGQKVWFLLPAVIEMDLGCLNVNCVLDL